MWRIMTWQLLEMTERTKYSGVQLARFGGLERQPLQQQLRHSNG